MCEQGTTMGGAQNIYQSKNTQTGKLSYRQLINCNDSRICFGCTQRVKAH